MVLLTLLLTFLPTDISQVLSEFMEIFETPTALPPRCACDYHIPLMEGARPVNIRPYRYLPELKSEIGNQIKEMIKSGVIEPSSSAFASPIIMVKKKDHAWRLCVDYRHLNLLTLKSKFPLPVIDELLDELTGPLVLQIGSSCWLSSDTIGSRGGVRDGVPYSQWSLSIQCYGIRSHRSSRSVPSCHE